MKPTCSNQQNQALTITEVLVVIVTLSLLGAVALAQAAVSQTDAQRKICVDNLKQDILAYKIWANDNSGKYPQQISVKKGGAREQAQNGNVAAIFQVMSNELSTPKILVCPADTDHSVAKFFTSLNNSHISYFSSLSASDGRPFTILIGDDNFTIGRKSAKSGLLEFSTNAPISWTTERHENGGNIGLAEGSVWETDDHSLVQKLVEGGLATNRLAIP